MTVDRDRLVSALQSALHNFGSDLDPDDIEEQAYFLAGEIDDAGIRLPEPVIGNPGLDSVAAGRIMTLEELEALPLTGVLGLHLEQLCGLDNVATMYCIEYVLDSYAKPPDAQIEEALLTTQSTQRACELCEREAVSTQHHLIPRAEHDLMVKRGHFTMDECRSRTAQLCRPCHSAVHKAKSTRELAIEYNTIDKLLEVPDISRFAEWNSRRKIVRTVVHARRRR